MKRPRPLHMVVRLTFNSILLVGILVLVLLVANVWSYSKLLHEQELGQIAIRQLADQRYQVRFSSNKGWENSFELQGDEWQLDVRLIRWRSWLALLGKDPLYRLDRISGRFTDPAQERGNTKSAYRLGNNPGIDIWALSRKHGDWVPGVEAVYGSSVYLPMADGGRYSLALSATGLTARAVNDPAKSAIADWNW